MGAQKSQLESDWRKSDSNEFEVPAEIRTPSEGIDHVYSEERSSQEIVDDIEATRDRLDDALDALGEALHPKSLLGMLFSWYRTEIGASDRSRIKENLKTQEVRVKNFVKENPLSVTLIGAGVLLAVVGEEKVRSKTGEQYRAMRLKTKNYADNTSSQVKTQWGSQVQNIKDKVHDIFQDTTQRVSRKAHDLGYGSKKMAKNMQSSAEKAAGAGEDLANNGREIFDESRQKAKEFTGSQIDRVEGKYRQSPLVLGAITLGIGVAIGLALPITRKEREVLGPYSKRMKRDAAGKVDSVIDKGVKKASDFGHEALDKIDRGARSVGKS